MLSIRDNSILFITNKSHKAHLLSCAKRCSSKLQKTQSLENVVSMAIQCTQNTYYFCIFLIFQFLKKKNFLILKQNKQKLKINKQKHGKQSKAKN